MAKKTAAKKTAAKKTATKAPAKKATKKAAKKAPAKKAPAKKAPAKKAARKAPAKKAPAKKAPAKKASKKAVKKPAAKKAPAKKASKKAVKKPAAKKAPAKKAAKKVASQSAKPKRRPVVREDESPWTDAELREVREELGREKTRLLEEIATAEEGLADLIRDSGDGAGDDQADAGSKTFEREHEMSLANNARDMLGQVEHALARISDGSYGVCESCGKPIGKYRLQAFPRATLCRSCKEAEERF